MSVLGKIVGQLEEGSGNIMNYYYTSGCYTKYELPEGSIFTVDYDWTQLPTNYLYFKGNTFQMTINGKAFTSVDTPLEFENYKISFKTYSGKQYLYIQSDNPPVEGTLEITNIKIGETTYPDETIPFKILPTDIDSNQVITVYSMRQYMRQQGYRV